MRTPSYWETRDNWNPNVPHCSEEARIQDEQGRDGGGHSQCLVELNADGSCPNQANHHTVFVAWINSLTECVPGVHHLASCSC